MTEEKSEQNSVEEQTTEKAEVEEKPLEQPHFDPEAEKKTTEAEVKPAVEVKSTEEVKPDEKSAEQKKAEANPEYMGNEMGEDILSIPLDDPVANAAASKIQVKSFMFDLVYFQSLTDIFRNYSEVQREKVSKTEFLPIVK